MIQRTKIKHVYEGQFVVEVEVTVLSDEHGWSPYLRLEDVHKLDAARQALRSCDLQRAAQYGRVYELRPVA